MAGWQGDARYAIFELREGRGEPSESGATRLQLARRHDNEAAGPHEELLVTTDVIELAIRLTPEMKARLIEALNTDPPEKADSWLKSGTKVAHRTGPGRGTVIALRAGEGEVEWVGGGSAWVRAERLRPDQSP